MDVFYCIPTYRSFDHCRNAIEAVMAGTLKPTQIVVIDNSGTGAAALAMQDLLKVYANLYFWPEPANTGVAPAWNRFMRELRDDYVIIANDDVAVHPNTVELLVNAAKSGDGYMYVGDHRSGNSFSLFLLTQEGYRVVGEFDDNFWPAYFEDNDYAYRLKLAGKPFIEVPEAHFDHVGSSTIRSFNEVERAIAGQMFEKNRHYYTMKWGGLPEQEAYTTPFGG